MNQQIGFAPTEEHASSRALLEVDDLRVYYHTSRGPVKAVDGVSFTLGANERLGLVGESGSGKSTTALALLRLIGPPGMIEGGTATLDGISLFALSEREFRRRRFADLALIPQGAMNSLNPVMRLKEQFLDTFRAHGVSLGGRAMRARVDDLLDQVGLGPEVADMYPHELSGGMKQRVCIALAISLRPKLIIADEPTSALDVVVQRQIIETLRRVQEDLGAAVILVGHDMGLMAQFVDRIGVMYAGRLVEISPVLDLFERPLHPYTKLLIDTLPSLRERRPLRGIPGLPPSLLDLPIQCAFNWRCPWKQDQCTEELPALRQMGDNRFAACLFAEDLQERRVG